MSAPFPLAVYGLVQDRLLALVSPFTRLELDLGDEEHLD